MIRRITLCSSIIALLASTTGCLGILNNLPIPIPGLGGQPSPTGEEIQLLYAKGVRAMMPDPIKDLKIAPTEKVWVVNENGGTNSDSSGDALTYDAIIDVLRGQGGCEVVARDDHLSGSLA